MFYFFFLIVYKYRFLEGVIKLECFGLYVSWFYFFQGVGKGKVLIQGQSFLGVGGRGLGGF